MNKKGQVVLEILVVVSILIIGLILFGLFFLRSQTNSFELTNIETQDVLQSPVDYSEVTVPGRISCGDLICEEGENVSNCPGDCSCGNTVCDASENCNSCPSDCPCPIPEPTCGDGLIDSGEDCDGSNLNGQTCLSQGFNSGTLSCNSNCTFNISACVNLPVCGNGIIEGTEQCDNGQLNGETCSSLGYDYGSLGCNPDCSHNTTECKFLPSNSCLNFDSGGWRKYDTTNPNWFTRGNMSTWPDHDAIWLCPTDNCQYITDYYFLYNSFLLSEPTTITISALGDDETKVWLWPNRDIANEILVIPQHVWIDGWISGTLELEPGNYSIVQLIYDTNQSATGAILSVKNGNTDEIIINTTLDSGWHYYRTMTQLEEERFSSLNGCSRVYSNQLCGNEIIEGNEQCEGSNLGDFSEKTCSDFNPSWEIGNLKCNTSYCQIDTSDCRTAITLTLTPETGSIRRNRTFNNSVFVIGDSGRTFDLTASVKLRNNVTGVYSPTSNCRYIPTGVYSSNFNLGNHTIPTTRDYSFSCNTRGTYMFTFKGMLADGKYSEDSSIWTINN
jgi:hypothetical protein